MTPPRLAPLAPPYAPEAARQFDRLAAARIPPLGLFRTVARNPRVLERLFAGNLLDPGSISLREREIVILRTCARTGCDYEWQVHAALIGKQAGLSNKVIAALSGPVAQSGLPAREQALMAAADALHDSATLPDAVWEALADHFDEAQRIEIIALAGYYHTVAFLCNALRVAPERFDQAPAPA